MVCMVFDAHVRHFTGPYVLYPDERKAKMIATGNINKECETPFVKCRSAGHTGHAFEFLIYLGTMSDTIHSMAFLLRPHMSECIESNFAVDCAAVKNLCVSNYETNIVHNYFNMTFRRDEAEYESNMFFIGKIFRDAANPSRWKIHLVWYDDIAVNSDMEALRDNAVIHMVDIYPELRTSQATILGTTEELCSAIRSDEFPILEKKFPPGGLAKEEFVKLLLRQLLLSRPFLQEHEKAASIVKSLSDLFEQIGRQEGVRIKFLLSLPLDRY